LSISAALFWDFQRRSGKGGKHQKQSPSPPPRLAMVFILAETAAGYAIFKAKDKPLKNKKTLADDLASVENATSMYVLLLTPAN
jgi:hypothetical protein